MMLPSRLDESLKSQELNDLAADTLDAVLDTTIESDALSNFPIINILYGAGKLYMTWSDRILTNKLLSFLSSFKDVPQDQRQKMIKMIDDDPRYRQTIGEKLLHVINQSENKVSANYLGQLFRAFILEKISYEDFEKCSYMLNRLPMFIIRMIRNDKFDTSSQSDRIILENSGLIERNRLGFFGGFRKGELYRQLTTKNLQGSGGLTATGKIIFKMIHGLL